MPKAISVATGREHKFKRIGLKYFGQVRGQAGPLKKWPFLLKRNGSPVDQASLDGQTINKFRNGAWISGPNGEFRFEDVPDANYSIEILYPTGKLVPKQYEPPNESGRRSPLPPVLDRLAFYEDPIDLLSEGDEAYVISAEVHTIGDTLLVNQDVRIIDPDTLEQVGDIITTGDDGVVRGIVPENKTYRIEMADADLDSPPSPLHNDEEPAILLCHFFDESGVPLAHIDVAARSDDDEITLTTDGDGKIEVPAHLRPYELRIGEQVFRAHALLLEDRERDENRYRFTVGSGAAQEAQGDPADVEFSYDFPFEGEDYLA